MEYFEKQVDSDCTIHSLNNALGLRAIDKEGVLRHIEGKVAEAREYGGPDEAEKLRSTLASGNTFFTAESVWNAAKAAGTLKGTRPVAGFGGLFTRVAGLPPDVRQKSSMVVLGANPAGGPHAIAVRAGKIYDSARHDQGPVEFNDENLTKSLGAVYAAYVMLPPGSGRDAHPQPRHLYAPTLIRA